jgi:hypothetical protein
MLHTKFIPGQDQNELMSYALHQHRYGYTGIPFKRDDTGGFGSGFLVRFDDGTKDEAPTSEVDKNDH